MLHPIQPEQESLQQAPRMKLHDKNQVDDCDKHIEQLMRFQYNNQKRRSNCQSSFQNQKESQKKACPNFFYQMHKALWTERIYLTWSWFWTQQTKRAQNIQQIL
ncbi:unnamed protein product [Paramecium primaurelia]|uniref:Uncharacterized protein n=1 Tax=Paramecium primaurelia TaxID=5886 RepID=A0A8S1QRT5_PARPR|nr:unnamed protein product [Paramecium primaurelia]